MARDFVVGPEKAPKFREGNPWRLVIDVNEDCNISCTYCHIDAQLVGVKKNSRLMPPTIARKLIRDADRMQIFDVTITGGEPTLAPGFLDIVRAASDSEFSSVQFITNGTRITKKFAEKLSHSGIARVSISIDDLGAGNDEARGAGIGNRALVAIQNCVDVGIPVNVISVLGKHNMQSWADLSYRLKDLGVRSQNASLMCRLGRAESANNWNGVPEEEVGSVIEMGMKVQADLCDETFFFHLNTGAIQSPGWDDEPTPIHAFQDRNPGIELVTRVDGSVIRNRIYGAKRSIGSIHSSPLMSLWSEDSGSRSRLGDQAGAGQAERARSYYHFAQFDRTDPHMVLRKERGSRSRNEPWGRVWFDPQTFCITDIEMDEDGDAQQAS